MEHIEVNYTYQVWKLRQNGLSSQFHFVLNMSYDMNVKCRITCNTRNMQTKYHGRVEYHTKNTSRALVAAVTTESSIFIWGIGTF